MSNYLHIKKFICKTITSRLPYKQRILYREALYWFSFADFFYFRRANYHIVSLGSNCLPRGLTTAIKLKPRRFYGEKSCVFDLYNSDLKRNIELIETDFKDFFSDIDLKNFPHDNSLPREVFVKRYQNRIKNFQDIMQSDKMLYFIYSDYDKVPKRDDILRLYKVLKDKRKNKPFKLILLISEYLPNLPEIIQIKDNFTIDADNWLVYIIDEYNEFDNKYTKYRDRMRKELKKVIFDNNFC